jgi:hypothetical protein
MALHFAQPTACTNSADKLIIYCVFLQASSYQDTVGRV